MDLHNQLVIGFTESDYLLNMTPPKEPVWVITKK